MKKSIAYFVLVLALLGSGCQKQEEPATPVVEDTVVESESTPVDGSITKTAQLNGEEIYTTSCAVCHDGGVAKAPHKTFLSMMTSSTIYKSMDDGLMKQQAAMLSHEQKTAVAEYLGGPLGVADAEPIMCAQSAFDRQKVALSKDMGFDLKKSRFQPADVSGLSKGDVPKLTLKWAFGFPSAIRARSLPLVAGGFLYVGSHDGTVYALDPETACVHWTFAAAAEVRTALTTNDWTVESNDQVSILYFGDIIANAYAINAASGELIWKTKVDDHDNATITGSPVFHDNRLYIPVSSLEVATAANPAYECCTFRGSMVSLDALTGEPLWKTFTIDELPQPTYKSSVGTQYHGPSGAPIWNSPTIDAGRNVLYAGTGENYSTPANGASDAIYAFNLDTGEVEWRQQVTMNDAWNLNCELEVTEGCPEEDGPDYDFGASPILIDLPNNKQVLVAGQKSGWLYGMDPEQEGAILWKNHIGRGGVQGGIHFGLAAEGTRVYVPITDFDGPPPFGDDYGDEQVRPGIYAVDANNGEFIWKAPHPTDVCNGRKYCDPGVSAAVTAIPGVVFSGGMDGVMRAHDGETGEVIWKVNTAVDYNTVNSVKAQGGSFGGPGPTVIDGTLYVNSGYGMYFHMPGNVLLAFSIDGN